MVAKVGGVVVSYHTSGGDGGGAGAGAGAGGGWRGGRRRGSHAPEQQKVELYLHIWPH